MSGKLRSCASRYIKQINIIKILRNLPLDLYTGKRKITINIYYMCCSKVKEGEIFILNEHKQ